MITKIYHAHPHFIGIINSKFHLDELKTVEEDQLTARLMTTNFIQWGLKQSLCFREYKESQYTKKHLPLS